MVQKRFLRLKTGELFYRYFGYRRSEAPVILLHPSPLSSAFLERLGLFLSDTFEVYAPDTPGYGLSEPLAHSPTSMRDYVSFLYAFLQKKRLRRVRLYGTATGCQLAIAFALAYPERVACLVGENACHFEDDERTALFQTYFPDLAPQADGSHLLRAWKMCYRTCVGFPWTAVPDDAALPPGVSLAQVQAMVRDTLMAGEHYSLAYRAAFEHERVDHIQALRVPAVFILWEHSPVRTYVERLSAFPMPSNIRLVRCSGDLLARYRCIREGLSSPQASELCGTQSS